MDIGFIESYRTYMDIGFIESYFRTKLYAVIAAYICIAKKYDLMVI